MAAALIILIVADEERKKLQRIRKNLRDLSNPFTIQESQFHLLYKYVYALEIYYVGYFFTYA